MDKASVVINTYNRADYLPNAIRSIASQTYSEIELVVVNGPSTDNTEEVLQKFINEGMHIKMRNCSSRNLSESRNIGISASSGDVIFFIDDDAVAHAEWVERLMLQYKDATVGAAGGFTVDHTGITYQCKYTVCDRRGNARFLAQIAPDDVLAAGSGYYYPSLLGTNCSFRSSALQKIGGFDEVFAYMLDETDVCARIYDIGMKIVTRPDALVFHKYAASHSRNTERIPTALLAPARSKVYFCFKHAQDGAKKSLAVHAEIDRYRRDITFANRWYLDHKKITPQHYSKISSELEQGIAEGISLGVNSGNFDKKSRHLINWVAGNNDFTRQVEKAIAIAATNRLKIYFVSQGYPPHDTAGIARWTHECARSLTALGHEIHVLTRTYTKSSHVDYIDGIWIHYLDDKFDDAQLYISPVPIPDSVSRRGTAVLKEIKRCQNVWGVDVVSAPIWDVEGILAAYYLELPIVLSLHTTYALALPFKKDWQANLNYRINHVNKVINAETWLLNNSKHILSNTSEVLKEIDQNYATSLANNDNRVSIVPHGFDLANSNKKHIPVNKQVVPNLIKILYVGRVEPRKGTDILLAALLKLNSIDCDLEVNIVGKPDADTEDFSKTVQDLARKINRTTKNIKLNFCGHVADEVLEQFYNSADIFVAPSRFESFGLILIEAMARGISVIATDVGGMREVLTHEVDGLLFRPESSEDLASKIRLLVTNLELRKRMALEAEKSYLEKFTGKKMALSLERFFKGVIISNSKEKDDTN